jgi:predicted transcriptional regulator
MIIDVLSQSMALLNEVGGRFRREEARCLREEGVKPEEIADLLGVSVDHVRAMLQEPV